MAKSTREKEIQDDLCVRREDIEKLFQPAPGKTTFYKLVNEGLIVQARGVSGYYLLNKTRIRLGMNPVDVKVYREGLENPRVESEPVVDSPAEKTVVTDLRSNPPAYMNVKEAAIYLTISPATLHREIKARRVKVVRVGRRVLLCRKDLDRYIETSSNWINEP